MVDSETITALCSTGTPLTLVGLHPRYHFEFTYLHPLDIIVDLVLVETNIHNNPHLFYR